MAIATTFNTAGDREDLTNALTILTPEDCPKTSMFPKAPVPFNMYQEWQVDGLLPVNFAGNVEGADFSSFTNQVSARARIGNRVQNFGQTWSVSRNQLAAEVAGVSNELANSKAKAMRNLKRSIEAMIGSDNDLQVGTGNVPSKCRALGKIISTSPGSDIPAAYITPTASIDTTATASLSESNFNDVFQSVFQQVGGRRSYTLFAGPSLKRAISNFQRVTGSSGTTKTYMVTQDATQHQIDLNVTIYEGDFHTVTVVPDLFNGILDGAAPSTTTNQQKARGYVVDADIVAIGTQFGVESVDNPDLGGGPSGYMRTAVTLMYKNPLGLGAFKATS
jgi:hypothetical protein